MYVHTYVDKGPAGRGDEFSNCVCLYFFNTFSTLNALVLCLVRCTLLYFISVAPKLEYIRKLIPKKGNYFGSFWFGISSECRGVLKIHI